MTRTPEQIIEWRGGPLNFRVDNGAEYFGAALQTWAQKREIGICYIRPGKPEQNAYVERFNRTVRTDWVGKCYLSQFEEAQDHAKRWLSS
ncbi:MAG: integrase core domain-containing protein [Pseudomonadota bacterium]